jgi:hypothetical protein
MADRTDRRLIRLRSLIVISLAALALSIALWGGVYLLTSAAMR